VLKNFEFISQKTYERIRTKFSANYAKQTQFFRIFQQKTMIPQKNKPNTNPILVQKQCLEMKANPNKPNLSSAMNIDYTFGCSESIICR